MLSLVIAPLYQFFKVFGKADINQDIFAAAHLHQVARQRGGQLNETVAPLIVNLL